MLNQPISLVRQQMQETKFPINTKVDIYHDIESGQSLQSFCCTGFVEGAFVIKNGTKYDMFYEVRNVTYNCCDECNRGEDIENNGPVIGINKQGCKSLRVCKETELRFSKGSQVTIHENEHSTNMKYGIVMGTVEVPNEIKLAEGPSFWYSIYVPSESKVINEVLPEKVKCDSRHLPDETIEDQPEGQDVPHIIVPHCGQSEASQLSIDKNDSDGNDLCSKVKQKTRLSPRERSTDHNNGRTNSTLSVPKIADRVEDMSISDNEQDENKLHQQSFDEKKRNIPESNDSDTHKEKQSAQKDMNTYKRQKLSETGYTNKDKYNESSPRRRNKSPSKISTCITTMADDDAETIQQSFDKDDKYEIWICNLPACHENTLKDDLQMLVNGNKVYIFEDQPAAKVKLNDQSDVDKYVAKLHNQVVLDGSKAPLRVVQKFSSSVPEDDEIKLIVENLWDDDDEEKIKNIFSEYSDVATVSLIKDINGTLSGAATVVFKDYRSKAIALRNMNTLKPYNIIDPDPNCDLKSRRKKAILKEKAVVSPTRRTINESNLSTSPTKSLKIQTTGTIYNKNPGTRFVAEIYIPLNLKRIKGEFFLSVIVLVKDTCYLNHNLNHFIQGAIIGKNGEHVKDLHRRTSCDIHVNDDSKRGPFCAEVSSNEEDTTRCGADIVLKQIVERLGYQGNRNFERECYFSLCKNDVPMEKVYPYSKQEIIRRIYLPLSFNDMKGFIIGRHGERHRKLQAELSCGIQLRENQNLNGCIINIINYDVKVARDGTDKMLSKLRKEYGDQIVDSCKVEWGK